MKKKIFLFSVLLNSISAIAQSGLQKVGVNTSNPQALFHIDGSVDNPKAGLVNAIQQLNDFVVTESGNVGIGTVNPSQKLEIQTGGTSSSPVTGFKLVDGTQRNGYALTSNANGEGFFNAVSANLVNGINGTGYNLPLIPGDDFHYTGASITLAPGRWLVNVRELLIPGGPTPWPNNLWLFVRTSFSDVIGVTGSPALGISPDVISFSKDVNGNIQSGLVSFLLRGSGSIGEGVAQTGVLIINNTGLVAKTYYYIAGKNNVGYDGATITSLSVPNYYLTNFASSDSGNVNKISAYRIN